MDGLGEFISWVIDNDVVNEDVVGKADATDDPNTYWLPEEGTRNDDSRASAGKELEFEDDVGVGTDDLTRTRDGFVDEIVGLTDEPEAACDVNGSLAAGRLEDTSHEGLGGCVGFWELEIGTTAIDELTATLGGFVNVWLPEGPTKKFEETA